ncbi:MAG: hypothetical protein HZA28_02410 [Candidatus Omnitrophica bacterium]|nr:hypothetical protein [Candidatus Omnitrophota bacterium]
MKFKSAACLFLAVFLFLFVSPKDSPGDLSTSPEWGFFLVGDGVELAKKTPGIKWTRFTGGAWGLFEKRRPEGGRHSYDFALFDERVRGLQGFDVNAVFVLHPSAQWAAGPKCKDEKGKFCPPQKEYLDGWKQFVKAVLERYDHDGVDDMPGLKKGFHYFEIGNEYQSPSQWNGSAAEYVEALRYAYEAKKEADPDAKIIVGGFTHLGSLKSYEEDPEQIRERVKFIQHAYQFTKEVLNYPQYFDMVDVHFFSYLKYRPGEIEDGIAWIKSTMRKNGYSKPIVCLEWTGAFSYPFDPEFDREKLKILLTGKPEKRYLKIRNEFEKEQAVEFAKMFTEILGGGCRLAIYVQFSDFPKHFDLPLWQTKGVVRADRKTHEILGPKPAYYVYALLNNKLSGIRKAERLSLGEDIKAYQFTVNEKRVIVAWSAGAGGGGRKVVNLKPALGKEEVSVTKIAVQGGGGVSTVTLEPSGKVGISAEPLIIE